MVSRRVEIDTVISAVIAAAAIRPALAGDAVDAAPTRAGEIDETNERKSSRIDRGRA